MFESQLVSTGKIQRVLRGMFRSVKTIAGKLSSQEYKLLFIEKAHTSCKCTIRFILKVNKLDK